ncbi:MAG: SAM hydroxide adenosyltransferase [Patescibacteria group bacterium]
MRKIICISDWAKDDLSFSEFATAIDGFCKKPKDVRLSRIKSESSTVHTGFLVEQTIQTIERLGRPNETMIFVNTDPRSVNDSIEFAQSGAKFLIAKLSSGIYVCGPNSGYSFAFVKSKIESVFSYVNFETTSISRSRDIYSRIVAHLADYMEDEMELEEVHTSTIENKPENKVVLHIDHFGNIVTSVLMEQALENKNYGGYLRINVGNEVHEARIVRDRFGGSPGEVVIYPGSKGHPDNPYMEIAVWHDPTNHTALKKHGFQNVTPGDEISFR